MKAFPKYILVYFLISILFISCKNTNIISKSNHTFNDIDNKVNFKKNPVFLFTKGQYYELSNIEIDSNRIIATTKTSIIPTGKYLRIESKNDFSKITSVVDSSGRIAINIKPVWAIRSVYEKKGGDSELIYHKQGPRRKLKHTAIAGVGALAVVSSIFYFVSQIEIGPIFK